MNAGRSPGTTEPTLVEELREIKLALDQHNRIIRRNRQSSWALGAAFALVTTLGVVGYIDDQNDDRRECRTDNENSVRDSEVLIGTVEQSETTPETRESIERYRESVRENLRDC